MTYVILEVKLLAAVCKGKCVLDSFSDFNELCYGIIAFGRKRQVDILIVRHEILNSSTPEHNTVVHSTLDGWRFARKKICRLLIVDLANVFAG
jgi:hypothetical protein